MASGENRVATVAPRGVGRGIHPVDGQLPHAAHQWMLTLVVPGRSMAAGFTPCGTSIWAALTAVEGATVTMYLFREVVVPPASLVTSVVSSSLQGICAYSIRTT
jgi:hypothetical protein